MPQDVVTDNNEPPYKGVSKDVLGVVVSVEDYQDKICCMCNTTETENVNTLLTCDKCDKSYHMHCLDLPFGFSLERHWFCFDCKTTIG